MPGTRKQRLQPEDVKKVIILARGVGGGESYFYVEIIFKCFETARKAAKFVITVEA